MTDAWDDFGPTPEDIAGEQPTPAIPVGKTYPVDYGNYREEGTVAPGTVAAGLLWAIGILAAICLLLGTLAFGFSMMAAWQ